jgi:hypothetical protein
MDVDALFSERCGPNTDLIYVVSEGEFDIVRECLPAVNP